jgi:hypothetical protein
MLLAANSRLFVRPPYARTSLRATPQSATPASGFKVRYAVAYRQRPPNQHRQEFAVSSA